MKEWFRLTLLHDLLNLLRNNHIFCLQGGVQINVIPQEMVASFDVRLACDVDHDQFEKMVYEWCKEAGSDLKVEFEQKNPKIEVTKLDDSNPWWIAFKKECDSM